MAAEREEGECRQKCQALKRSYIAQGLRRGRWQDVLGDFGGNSIEWMG